MPHSYSYTVTEYDPEQPWIIAGETRHLTVELEDGQNFYDWAAEQWPRPRFTVELDPWQLAPTDGGRTPRH